MEKLILFGILSVPIIVFSWRSLFNIKSHGFFRFFAFESIIWLFVSNYSFWFNDPLHPVKIVSWVLLFISLYMAIVGIVKLVAAGKPHNDREADELHSFEKTTRLVESGIYRYIRHPLYSSLIFLTWGIYLKNTELILLPVALISTVCLVITSLQDEKECIVYFGPEYSDYMKKTRRFIPFIF